MTTTPVSSLDNLVTGNVQIRFVRGDERLPELPESQAFVVPLETTATQLTELLVDCIPAISEYGLRYLVQSVPVSQTLGRSLLRAVGQSAARESLVDIQVMRGVGSELGAQTSHNDWISVVRCPIAGKPRLQLTGSYDRVVRVWVGDKCVANSSSGGHLEAVMSLAIKTSTIIQQDIKQKRGRRRQYAVDPVSFECVSVGKDARLCHWTMGSAEGDACVLHQSGLVHAGAIESVDLTEQGNTLIATAGWDGSVRVFDWASTRSGDFTPKLLLEGHNRPVLSTRFAQHRLYSGGLDGLIRVWDLGTQEATVCFSKSHIPAVQCLAVDSEGICVLSGHTDNAVRLIDTRLSDSARSSGSTVTTFTGHQQWVYAVCWASRQDDPRSFPHFFASASEDASIMIWDVRSNAAPLLRVERAHTSGILDVTFAGGSTFVSSGKDHKTRITSMDL